MFKPSSLPWPVSRDRGLMYFCIYVYVPCAVLWLLSLLFPLVSLCVFIYVRTPRCFGSQRDCNPEVFLRWKLPHLPLISHRQLQLMASFRAPYLRVWLSQAHQDCRDSCHKSDITSHDMRQSVFSLLMIYVGLGFNSYR